jgi:hypothetical protein
MTYRRNHVENWIIVVDQNIVKCKGKVVPVFNYAPCCKAYREVEV